MLVCNDRHYGMTLQTSYQDVRSALLRRVFRRASHYRDLADRCWTISPSEDREERPAIFLDGELDRVKAVQEETTKETEWRRVLGGMRQHDATVAYQFSNVQILGGRLLKGAMSHVLSQLADHAVASEDVAMPQAAIGTSYMGSIYFGHWMRDDATLRLAAKDLAPTIDIARQPYSHEKGYRALLSLGYERVTRGHFDELFMLDDWSQNAYKRERYRQLRAAFRRTVSQSGNGRIYIKRGRASGLRGRDLVNAADVEAFLVRQGFTVVDPDSMSADEIARLSCDAKVFVSVEGSHLAHSIYPIADGGTIVVLQPPCRFNNVYKDLSDAVGLRYAFIVGEVADNGFAIDVDRLGHLLDAVPA